MSVSSSHRTTSGSGGGRGEEVPVHVCIRVRPLLERETEAFDSSCVRVEDGRHVVVGGDRRYAFDRVFSGSATGPEVFSGAVKRVLDRFIDGYHATLLAYGPTGGGKTHTMTEISRLAVEYLDGAVTTAASSLSRPKDMSGAGMGLSLSVLEVYNEQVVDLLDVANPKLTVREDSVGEVFVAGLRQATVPQAADLLPLIRGATSNRSTAATSLNVSSSRSHCVVTITWTRPAPSSCGVNINSTTTTTSSTTASRLLVSRLTLVDLAGSERIKKAHHTTDASTTERVREGIHINSGLLALGNVIHALCEKRDHVPFRSSKLTRILQSSLAGNSVTLMLCCISSSDRCMDETLNTLKYADRVKQLKLTVSRSYASHADSNGDASAALLESYEGRIVELQEEVAALRKALQAHHIPVSVVTVPQSGLPSPLHSGPMPPPASAVVKELQSRIMTLEEDLAKERRFSKTLEEDLYRSEYTTMREVERRREMEALIEALQGHNHLQPTQAALHSALTSSLDQTIHSGQGDASTFPAQHFGASPIPNTTTITAAISADGACCDEAEDDAKRDATRGDGESVEVTGKEAATQAVETYQRRLRTALADKERLQQELARAEQRLDWTPMDSSKREQQRLELKASYEAKLRAAEVAATEYQRRVRDAERAQRDTLRPRGAAPEPQPQRGRSGTPTPSHTDRSVSGAQRPYQQRSPSSTSSSVPRGLFSFQPPSAGVEDSRESTATGGTAITRAASPVRDSIASAVAALEALERDLTDAEAEREAVRIALSEAQESSDTARWRRAVRGFQLRLDQVEAVLVNRLESTTRSQYEQERRELRQKMIQLEELRPACDDAVEALREIDGRIDSLQAARHYHLRRVRSLQSRDDHFRQSRPTVLDAVILRSEHKEIVDGLAATVRAQQKHIAELQRKLTELPLQGATTSVSFSTN